jgi:hypothetical protein
MLARRGQGHLYDSEIPVVSVPRLLESVTDLLRSQRSGGIDLLDHTRPLTAMWDVRCPGPASCYLHWTSRIVGIGNAEMNHVLVQREVRLRDKAQE